MNLLEVTKKSGVRGMSKQVNLEERMSELEGTQADRVEQAGCKQMIIPQPRNKWMTSEEAAR